MRALAAADVLAALGARRRRARRSTARSRSCAAAEPDSAATTLARAAARRSATGVCSRCATRLFGAGSRGALSTAPRCGERLELDVSARRVLPRRRRRDAAASDDPGVRRRLRSACRSARPAAAACRAERATPRAPALARALRRTAASDRSAVPSTRCRPQRLREIDAAARSARSRRRPALERPLSGLRATHGSCEFDVGAFLWAEIEARGAARCCATCIALARALRLDARRDILALTPLRRARLSGAGAAHERLTCAGWRARADRWPRSGRVRSSRRCSAARPPMPRGRSMPRRSDDAIATPASRRCAMPRLTPVAASRGESAAMRRTRRGSLSATMPARARPAASPAARAIASARHDADGRRSDDRRSSHRAQGRCRRPSAAEPAPADIARARAARRPT